VLVLLPGIESQASTRMKQLQLVPGASTAGTDEYDLYEQANSKRTPVCP
jgi:hypothetical protein